jgi:phosphoribosylglycinamide formyltransferase-1
VVVSSYLWNRGQDAPLCRPAVLWYKKRTVNDKQLYRLGVLGSGKGSNMVAIAEACASGAIAAQIALVISDVENAGILSHARARGIPAGHLAPGPFRTKLDEGSEKSYIEALRQARVECVVMAGFMRILKGEFLRAFPGRVINIHPALLPSFPGLEAWKQALDYGVKFTGCTVHFVDQGVDTGPVIAQQVVPVLDDDTPETLHERIQQAERVLYPAVIGQLALGNITVQGRRTRLRQGQ